LLFDLRGPQDQAYYQVTHTWTCNGYVFPTSIFALAFSCTSMLIYHTVLHGCPATRSGSSRLTAASRATTASALAVH
jgi:hypothetical protein